MNLKIVGIALIALGVIGLLYGGIHYTTRDRVVDLGPLHASADRDHTLPIAPLVAVALLVGGGVLVIGARRRG